MKIYKYPLKTMTQALEVPLGAEVLKVAEQHGVICLWALVDPDAPKEGRVIHIVGTGQDIPWPREDLEYLGTVLTRGGDFVWHVFWHKQGESRLGGAA